MRRLIAALAASVAMLVAGAAIAGEVKGPPGTVDNTNFTAAAKNANSNCAYSGLNDLDSEDPVGQNESNVQTAADAFKYYDLPHGVQGRGLPEFGVPGFCRGGTNESRDR